MAVVTGKTSDAMDAIADESITTGAVNISGRLILTTRGGTDVDAGSVIGPAGPTGSSGSTGSTGATGPTGPSGAVSGLINMWGTGSAPTGWLLCDGSAVSRATFSGLFAVIGTTFGTGDGSTTFNLPNMQGKYARMDTAALGTAAGASTHDHDLEGGTPVSQANVTISAGSAPNVFVEHVTSASWTSSTRGDATTAATASDVHTSSTRLQGHTAASSHLPPFLNLNFIIKT